MLLTEIDRNIKYGPEPERPLESVLKTEAVRAVSEHEKKRRPPLSRHRLRGVILEKKTQETAPSHDSDWVTLGTKPGTIVRRGGKPGNPPLYNRFDSQEILVIAVPRFDTESPGLQPGDEVLIEPAHPSQTEKIEHTENTTSFHSPSTAGEGQDADYILHLSSQNKR